MIGYCCDKFIKIVESIDITKHEGKYTIDSLHDYYDEGPDYPPAAIEKDEDEIDYFNFCPYCGKKIVQVDEY